MSLALQSYDEPDPEKHSERLSESEWSILAEELSLSPRQGEIVRLIFDGLDQGSIARTLGIQPDTVHAHLSNLYRKLDVHSRCELIVQVFLAYVDCFGRRPESEALQLARSEMTGTEAT